MSIFEAFILGLIQGVTEFLPVSSSGHLVITENVFQIKESNLAFAVLLHVATFFAIVAAYRQTVFMMIKEFGLMVWDLARLKGARLKENKYRRYIVYIIIGCIPAGVAGILLEDLFDKIFGSLPIVACTLILTGFVLLLAEKISGSNSGKLENLGWGKSLLVGLFQMCAIMPGLSRSGTTMTGGLVAGLKKEEALEFSFLLALPTIAGSAILKVGDIFETIGTISPLPVIVGFLTALIFGYLSIVLFKAIVKKGSLLSFSVYCWSVGLIILLNLGRF
ncbi:MAG: undecaprenyl-diphosphate phosphatase [Eubacteriaceae bacterium]|nr:undecaprenyl-diphosphate phosphatase [Eubacteriaceae bacterium]